MAGPATVPGEDPDRFALVDSALYTAVIGDVCDEIGLVHQFLPPEVRPLEPGMRLSGRAMPVRLADVYGRPGRPFGRLTEALDALRPGDVYLTRRGRQDCAAWGEIMTTAARSRGARGAVVDSFHRDTPKVLDQNFPVFSRGSYGQDSGARSVVCDYGVVIEVGAVTISPGDLVVGDVDGVLVVPAGVEVEVLERALAKVAAEDVVRRAIEGGMSASDAWAAYGVL